MTRNSSSGARVDAPGSTAQMSKSVATPTVIVEGSEAGCATIEGREAGTGSEADAMDAEEAQ